MMDIGARTMDIGEWHQQHRGVALAPNRK